MINIRYNPKRKIGCKSCETDEFTEYSEKYDTYYCTKCDEWTESKCDCGDDCPFPERPNKPSIDN